MIWHSDCLGASHLMVHLMIHLSGHPRTMRWFVSIVGRCIHAGKAFPDILLCIMRMRPAAETAFVALWYLKRKEN